MGDKIDIYKITLDFLKGNKVLFLLVSTALAGGAAGHFIPPMIDVKPVEVTVTAPKSTPATITPVIIKHECKRCDEEIKALKAEIKTLKAEDANLKQWHGG